MSTRPTASPSPNIACASAVLAILIACGGDETKPTTSGVKAVPVGKDSSAVVDADVKAEGGDVKAEGGDVKAEGGDAKAEGGDAKADAGDISPKSTTEVDPSAEGGDAKADDTGGAAPAADPAALQTEIKGKKTTDERALAALAELETSGAKLRDVAKAANARGEKLFDTPDRAKTFFEWAAAKDPKYPDPMFNLAKQSATLGEVEATREYLKQVKARGGKKLLSQIDFDPMWEIVKDDPEVRKLLEG